MHILILLCLVTAITAANNGGYSYNRASGQNYRPSHHGSGFIGSGSAIASPAIHHHAQQQHSAPAQSYEEVNKEFYTFSAPEEDFAIPQQEHQGRSVSRRNLQIIFIRAPEQAGLNRAVQNLAQQNLEQQTAIYVLTKQPDLSQLSNSLQQESNQIAHKPEVHFVKYRTSEDAARAQQSIRAQYDALGGSSSNSQDAIAPVLNFASQNNYQGQSNSIGGQGGTAQLQQPGQNYLPPGF